MNSLDTKYGSDLYERWVEFCQDDDLAGLVALIGTKLADQLEELGRTRGDGSAIDVCNANAAMIREWTGADPTLDDLARSIAEHDHLPENPNG